MTGIIAAGCFTMAWRAALAVLRAARRIGGRAVCAVRGHRPTEWAPARCHRCGGRIR